MVEKKDLVLGELTRILVSEAGPLRETYEKESVDGIQFVSVSQIVKDIYQVMNMNDPQGNVIDSKELLKGLKVAKISITKGTLGFVYDGDPIQVLSIAAKAIKTNSHLVILANSKTEKICKLLVKFIKLALEAQDMPIDIVKIVTGESLEDFFQRKELDLILAGGSQELWNDCQRIGFKKIEHDKKKKGLSHLYVDELVNVEGAISVILDSINEEGSKHPIGTVLVHSNTAGQLLPVLFSKLIQKQFLLHLDTRCWNIFNAQFLGKSEAQLATDADWFDSRERKDLNVGIVDSLEDGIIHILQFGSKHYEGILSDIPLNSMVFSSTLDAHQILINASSAYCRENNESRSDLLKAESVLKLEELMGSRILIQGNYFSRQLT